jgi:PIN domain nuclease of toxin-antitoxin system
MFLLDTHIVLAVLGQGSVVIPQTMKNALSENTASFVSVATIWEIAIKSRLGKIDLTMHVPKVPLALEELNIRLKPVETSHALAVIGVDSSTKDPFDRLLLGVCAAEGMKLVTLDRVLAQHPLAWRES